MKMLLPPNWDKPGKGNDKLCAKFGKKVYYKTGFSLNYRYYEPPAGNGKLMPLVLYLHGADAAGDDNELQLSMHDIGTFLVRDDLAGRYPCYILAPQYGEMKHWAMPEIKDLLWDLVDDTIKDHPDIDVNRVYIYGYSAGGVGTLRLIKERPGFFASALSICGATGSWNIENLLKTPLYMVHAADDTIVKATYRTKETGLPGNYGSADIYDRFGGEHKDMIYDEYPPGFMKEHFGVNPHCSWVAVSDLRNLKIWEWLFSQKLKDSDRWLGIRQH
ncbi:MAG TPA: hypothetical protein DIS78_00975 [Lachnospiraceae bacterium]|nr:hypothetical protein [Lachnospiraceae bacterium]